MKKIPLIIAILLLLASCKNTAEIKVYKLDKTTTYTDNAILYALPRTVLKFKVEAVKTRIVPGPYHKYAKMYLGIENVPSEIDESWKISNITIGSYNEIDPSQYYLFEPEGKFQIDLDAFVKEGLIIPVNLRLEQNSETVFWGSGQENHQILFTDLSVRKFVGEEEQTYYKRVRRDSLFAKVPVVKKEMVYKSLEDKAEEAANFIIMIREKRFELLTGMADFFPDGKALEASVKELNRLEKEYLELFTGKKQEDKFQIAFEYIIQEKDLERPVILFRFSEDKGILSSNDITGRPIFMEVLKQGISDNVELLIGMDIENNGEGLFYRIPDKAILQILDGKNILATTKLSIEQLGKVYKFPTKFLMSKESFVEFYREEEK